MSPTARVRRWTRFVLDFAFFAAFCAMVYTTWEIKSKAFELLRLRTEQIQTLEKITRTQQEMIDAQNDVINIMIDDSSIPCEMPPRELRSTT